MKPLNPTNPRKPKKAKSYKSYDFYCSKSSQILVNCEFYKILQQAPETKTVNKIDEENIYQLKKVDFTFITSNKLTKKLEYEKMMKDIFTKVNDFDFNGLQEEKQERYINQMAI